MQHGLTCTDLTCSELLSSQEKRLFGVDGTRGGVAESIKKMNHLWGPNDFTLLFARH